MMSVITWIIIGLIAGWIAGVLMRGRGFGIVGNIAVGIIGAIIGGFVGKLVGIVATSFLGNIVVAIIGAVILLAIIGAIRK